MDTQYFTNDKQLVVASPVQVSKRSYAWDIMITDNQGTAYMGLGKMSLKAVEKRFCDLGYRHVNGVVLEEKTSYITNQEIVVIATFMSSNIKTDNMVQIWILVRDMTPVVAHSTRCDVSVCGDCPHRVNGTCYVALFQGPRAVWQAYTDGNYPRFNGNYDIFRGRKVRFGAYGDPSLISKDIITGICNTCDGWTGYTHQWKKSFAQGLNTFFMASTDNPEQVKLANSLNWNTFMALPHGTDRKDLEFKSRVCPASIDDSIHCLKCGKCNGFFDGILRNIVIPVHGKGENSYQFAE